MSGKRGEDRMRSKQSRKASKRATEQPRDDRGRFTSTAKLVLIDESGDLGRKCSKGKYLVVTAMVTDEPKQISDISSRYPKNTKRPPVEGKEKELKFESSSASVRMAVLRDIGKTDPVIYAVATDKMSRAGTWPRYGARLYSKSVEYLINEVASDNRCDLDVVMDENTALRQREIDMMRISSNRRKGHGKIRNIEQRESSKTPELQTNDFVTGSIGYEYNSERDKYDRKWYSKIIGPCIRRKTER